MAELFLTDERQYRDPQPCDDVQVTGCPADDDPGPHLPRQEAEALDQERGAGLEGALEPARERDDDDGPVHGSRPVTPTTTSGTATRLERKEILESFVNENVKNLVVLSGDIHTFIAGDLYTNGETSGDSGRCRAGRRIGDLARPLGGDRDPGLDAGGDPPGGRSAHDLRRLREPRLLRGRCRQGQADRHVPPGRRPAQEQEADQPGQVRGRVGLDEPEPSQLVESGSSPDKVLVTGGTGFLGGWCIVKLLERGYEVRTTVRDLKREPRAARRRWPRPAPTAGERARGRHRRSHLRRGLGGGGRRLPLRPARRLPFPPEQPKDPDELIVPARDGALRVLSMALEAGAERVVMTSSIASIRARPRVVRAAPYTEDDWTDGDDTSKTPYIALEDDRRARRLGPGREDAAPRSGWRRSSRARSSARSCTTTTPSRSRRSSAC